jgi:hypothetical protein
MAQSNPPTKPITTLERSNSAPYKYILKHKQEEYGQKPLDLIQSGERQFGIRPLLSRLFDKSKIK